MEPSSPLSAARAADAADAALEAGAGDEAPLTRSPFKRLASRTLSDRWQQELAVSPNELARARGTEPPRHRNAHVPTPLRRR